MTLDHQSSRSEDEREALEFLRQGRILRGLSPAQFRRIEARLTSQARLRPNRRWVVALASLSLVLVAGSALGRVMDFSRLPVIGSLLSGHRSGPASHLPLANKPSLSPAPASTHSGGVAPVAPPSLSVVPLAAPAEVERLEHRPAATSTAVPPRSLAHANAASPQARSVAFAERQGAGTSREASLALAAPALAPRTAAQDWRAGQVANLEPAPVVWPRAAAWPSPAPSAARGRTADEPVLSESQSLSAAGAEWHRDHNASAALAALDAHHRKFRDGQMQLETTLLRAEIVLDQGREREGLALLDSVSLAGLPRGRELQTVRGELRIKVGRCADGRRDLGQVLAKDAADELGHRAARALALCP